MRAWTKIALFLLSFGFCQVQAQDDLMNLLEDQANDRTEYTFATFKSTRLVSGHSIETNGEGVLQFMIMHRFGRVNNGWRDLWGIDNASVRLGLEYGLTDDLNIGFGRSSFGKVFDFTAKYKFLKQKKGARNFPFTATLVSVAYLQATEWADPERENLFSSRLSYHNALLIARKFKDISVQLMPTLVHRNLVATEADENSVFSMGFGASTQVSPSVRLNVEYFYLLPDQIASEIGGEEATNTLSFGVDIETGGHVFQLHITNSRGMTERFLATETTGDFLEGDIHFGFNVSRVFTLKKPKPFRK